MSERIANPKLARRRGGVGEARERRHGGAAEAVLPEGDRVEVAAASGRAVALAVASACPTRCLPMPPELRGPRPGLPVLSRPIVCDAAARGGVDAARERRRRTVRLRRDRRHVERIADVGLDVEVEVDADPLEERVGERDEPDLDRHLEILEPAELLEEVGDLLVHLLRLADDEAEVRLERPDRPRAAGRVPGRGATVLWIRSMSGWKFCLAAADRRRAERDRRRRAGRPAGRRRRAWNWASDAASSAASRRRGPRALMPAGGGPTCTARLFREREPANSRRGGRR